MEEFHFELMCKSEWLFNSVFLDSDFLLSFALRPRRHLHLASAFVALCPLCVFAVAARDAWKQRSDANVFSVTATNVHNCVSLVYRRNLWHHGSQLSGARTDGPLYSSRNARLWPSWQNERVFGLHVCTTGKEALQLAYSVTYARRKTIYLYKLEVWLISSLNERN